MKDKRINRHLYFMILAGILLIIARNTVFAREAASDPLEKQREEFRLKHRLMPILTDVLKDEYVALSVNVRYILQHEPILSKNSKVKRLKLPGFGTQITVANKANEISGYIDKQIRYRTLVLIVRRSLLSTIEESLTRLLNEKGDLDLGGKDVLSIIVLAGQFDQPDELKAPDFKKAENGKKNKVDDLIRKIDEDRKDKQDRLAKLFPDLKQPIEPVNPRVEAQSSKHLILSRKAFYNNDLNLALNEVIEAININPYSPKCYEMLGSIYYRLKWHNLALTNWEKALALDPENKKLNQYIAKVKNEL
ncbi:MAG: tetratricopeptide repeat protein [Proteobacteria bacterium]|nr:tetratricopeptide repeat protein [Pseudomonadota bacterium]